MAYHLILHEDLRAQINVLNEERKRNPSGEAAKEYVAVIKGLQALRDGREGEYQGKQLGYGPGSHDLRDCAELKVPVVAEFTPGGHARGPSHRLVYREFDPLPTVQDGRVVNDPNAPAYRQVVTFAHRGDDPAAITGQRLARVRGIPDRNLHGLTGGGRPEVGPQRPGVQTTPHRVPVPQDLLRQAAILRDSPPPGTRPAPSAAPQAKVSRPDGPAQSQSHER